MHLKTSDEERTELIEQRPKGVDIKVYQHWIFPLFLALHSSVCVFQIVSYALVKFSQIYIALFIRGMMRHLSHETRHFLF